MGKVKPSEPHPPVVSEIVYQFPMGKVKKNIVEPFGYGGFVSIPYGKGKAGINQNIGTHTLRYQFPMGKVKWVHMTAFQSKHMYQFPMGKVKLMLMYCMRLICKSINSLWER